MRGSYRLDEVTGMHYDTPCVKFKQGKRTIVSINLHDDHYEFQIILGRAEREKFEAARHEFPKEIQELYDRAHTFHDGKWLFIPVGDPDEFEAVKKLIRLKKKPNRKPLSRENAVFGKCGHRCDMCVHYVEVSDEFRAEQIPHLESVYGVTEWEMRCTGCDTAGCHCCGEGAEMCEPLQCLHRSGLASCFDCGDYPCEHATVGYRELEYKNITAEDVTLAILPYVPNQYEESKQ